MAYASFEGSDERSTNRCSVDSDFCAEICISAKTKDAPGRVHAMGLDPVAGGRVGLSPGLPLRGVGYRTL